MGWWRIVLLNRVLRHFLHATPWHFPGSGWIWFHDQPGSKTLELVYREMRRGDYQLPVPLNPGDTVLDLGAHVGMFTIPLARRYPQVIFHCVEPDWRNYRNLQRNTAGLSNVILHHAAAGRRGAAGIQRIDPNNTGSNRTTYVIGPGNGIYLPESIPIRDWIKVAGGTIKLLKLDIEGAEFQDFNPAKDLHGVEAVIGELHAWGGNAELLAGQIRGSVKHTSLQVHA